MISLNGLMQENEARKKLKKMKISVWKAIVSITAVSGSIFIYYQYLLPFANDLATIKSRVEMVPAMSKSIDSIKIVLTQPIILIDKDTAWKIALTRKLNKMDRTIISISTKVDIIPEVFPILDDRFDAIDAALDKMDENEFDLKINAKRQ